MKQTSADALAQAKDAYEASVGPASKAAATAASADSMMQQDNVKLLTRNIDLAKSMITHNDAYPALYDSLRPYIPPFFRVTSYAATPISDTQAAMTLTGTLATYQQYSDLMLALMRNQAAVSVSRSGFNDDDPYVPQLTQADQIGKPHAPGASPIPDDPLQRLAYFQAQATTPGAYTGQGNFGSGTDATRSNMEGESLVTVQLILNAAIQTPNPRATLGAGGGTTGGGGGGFQIPGRPGGGGGGAGTVPNVPPPSGGTGGGGSRAMER